MPFFQAIISSVARAFADLIGVVPVGEYNSTPPSLANGEGCSLQLDDAGNLKVASAGTASLSSLLSEVQAKVPAKGQAAMAASTPVTLASNQSVVPIGAYNSTTPSKSSGALGGAEFDKKGNLHVTSTMRDSWEVIFTNGLAADASSLPGGACDRICTDTDNLFVYAQSQERELIASQAGTAWTGAAGWSRDGNVWTHAAGGGTGDLEITSDATKGVRAGKTYAVIFTVTITAGTSITAKLGTGAGTARTATGTYVQLVTAATTGKIIFTPTNDLACTIDVTSVYVIPHLPPFFAGVDYERAAVKIVAVASASTPATAHTTAKVWALWNRRLGATEVT